MSQVLVISSLALKENSINRKDNIPLFTKFARAWLRSFLYNIRHITPWYIYSYNCKTLSIELKEVYDNHLHQFFYKKVLRRISSMALCLYLKIIIMEHIKFDRELFPFPLYDNSSKIICYILRYRADLLWSAIQGWN